MRPTELNATPVRDELLGRCLADGGRFRDPATAVDGARQLAEHIGMVQRLTGGARLAGRGAPEACHGLVRFGWAIVGPDQTILATGTNVVDLSAAREAFVAPDLEPLPV